MKWNRSGGQESIIIEQLIATLSLRDKGWGSRNFYLILTGVKLSDGCDLVVSFWNRFDVGYAGAH